jgi:hypothetical protein
MKRIIMTVAATLLAAVPATVGLVGNTSFAQSVPVRVPSQAVVVDDTAGQSRHLSDTTRKVEDKGLTKEAEPGDDKGGLTKQAEPGDDKVSESGSGKDGKGGHGGDKSGESGKDDGSGRS